MTPPTLSPQPTVAPRRSSRVGHWILITLAAMAVVAVVEAASLFRLSREAGEVRTAISRVIAGDASTEVQFSVGPGTLGLARFVAGFIDEVPPEALKAMEAVHQASVGVYRLHTSPTATERIGMLQAATDRMAVEGWHRVVAVHDGGDLVMVFAPESARDPLDLQFCIVVCDGDDLVVVSANGSAAPLRDLAAMHSGEWREALHGKSPDRM